LEADLKVNLFLPVIQYDFFWPPNPFRSHYTHQIFSKLFHNLSGSFISLKFRMLP
jgi:hypothetical protein